MPKAVIIGCGAICQSHIGALAAAKVALSALCDTDKPKAEAAAKGTGAAVYTDYKKMIAREKPDAVHVCTPHFLHAQMSVFALGAGSHVFLEKPAATSEKELGDIARARDESGKKVGVCFQNRYNASVRAALRVLKSGSLGALLGMKADFAWKREGGYYTASPWRGKWATEGGSLLVNQAIHTLDLLQLFGGELQDVRGEIMNLARERVIETEDTAAALIRFKNGISAVFFATNSYFKDEKPQIELQFEKGLLRLADARAYEITENGAGVLADDVLCKTGKSVWGGGHEAAIKDFYRALEDGTDDYVTFEDGRIAADMCLKIYESSKTKDFVRF